MFGQYTISNNVRTTLNTTINAGATSIILNDAAAPFINFPDPASDTASNGFSVATLVDSLTAPTKFETVRYSSLGAGIGTHTLNGVTRGFAGTTAQSWTAGACFVYQAPLAQMMQHPKLRYDAISDSFDVYAVNWDFMTSTVTFGGNLDLTTVGSISWGPELVPYSSMQLASARSILGNPNGVNDAPQAIAASVANTVPLFTGSGLSFQKVPVAAFNTTGTANTANMLRGDGAWTNSVSGSWTVGVNFTLSSGTFTVPSNVIARAALVNTPGVSVLGKASSGSGSVGDIVSSADGQYLKRSGGALVFGAPTLAELPNAGLSVLARVANSSGERTNLAPATTTGGDEMFVENAALVFDSYIRKRRNIMQGFWEFENGVGDAPGAGGNNAYLPGTPLKCTTVGTAVVSHADRGSAYTRNALVLINSSVSTVAVTLGDVTAMTVGMPTAIGPLIIEIALSLNQLSTASEEYALNLGGVCGPTLAGDGVFFQYQRTSSLNWRLVARNGGATTVTTSSSAVALGAYRLRIEITASNLATFYVNGTSVGTVTTNIPPRVGIGAVQDKTVHASVTNFNDIDYMAYRLAMTTPRSATQR